MEHTLSEWIIFSVVIISLLLLDLGVLNKNSGQAMTFRQSALLSLFHFLIACFFSIYIFYKMGEEPTKEYFTGFLIEKAMALDNIFVISIIFRFFVIPKNYQSRVLLWGIVGVIIFRAIMIGVGSALIIKFAWLLYFFAGILILTGIKIIFIADKNFDVKELYIYKFLQKHLNITSEINTDKFFVKINNKIYATPLFIALIIIEAMDLVFAIDSIPAIFAITTDIYIVYTSNIFAILGLRALYFCLAEIVEKFKYLKYSLGIILIFIGIKIFISPKIIKIPTYFSLSITILLLILGVIISIIKAKKAENNSYNS